MDVVTFFANDWKVDVPKPHLEGLEFIDAMCDEWEDEPIEVLVGYLETPAMLLCAVKANQALNRLKGAVEYIRTKMDTDVLRYNDKEYGHDRVVDRELWEINHQLAIALKEKKRYEKYSDGNEIFDWMIPGTAPDLPTFTDLEITENMMNLSGKRNMTAFRYLRECYYIETARLKEERRRERLRREEEKRQSDLALMTFTMESLYGDGKVDIEPVYDTFFMKHTERHTHEVTICAVSCREYNTYELYKECTFYREHPEIVIQRVFASNVITFGDPKPIELRTVSVDCLIAMTGGVVFAPWV